MISDLEEKNRLLQEELENINEENSNYCEKLRNIEEMGKHLQEQINTLENNKALLQAEKDQETYEKLNEGKKNQQISVILEQTQRELQEIQKEHQLLEEKLSKNEESEYFKSALLEKENFIKILERDYQEQNSKNLEKIEKLYEECQEKNKEIESFNKKIQVLEKENFDLNRQNNEFEEKINGLSEANQNLLEKIQEIEGQQTENLEKKAENDQILENMQKELNEKSEIIKEITEKFELLGQENAQARAVIEEKTENEATFHNTIENLEKELALKENNSMNFQNFNENIQNLNLKLKNLEESLQANILEKDSYCQKYTAQLSMLQDLQQKIAEFQRENEEIREKLELKDLDIQEAQTKVQVLEEQISHYQISLEKKNNEYTSLTEKFKHLTDSLITKENENESPIKSPEKQIADLQSEVSTLHFQLELRECEKNTLENKLNHTIHIYENLYKLCKEKFNENQLEEIEAHGKEFRKLKHQELEKRGSIGEISNTFGFDTSEIIKESEPKSQNEEENLRMKQELKIKEEVLLKKTEEFHELSRNYQALQEEIQKYKGYLEFKEKFNVLEKKYGELEKDFISAKVFFVIFCLNLNF